MLHSKPFRVAKAEPRSCSASAFPYFEVDAEIGVDGAWETLRKEIFTCAAFETNLPVEHRIFFI